MYKIFRLLIAVFIIFALFPPNTSAIAASNISNISLNSISIPLYEKLEITFQLQSSAQNLFFPYTQSPPPGITESGITVNAIFTSPSGKIYIQPAFLFQSFETNIKGNSEDWIYPTNDYSWKVRFSPPSPGTWSFSLQATDSAGTTQSPSTQFEVTPSTNKGFIRVSPNDPRYFEYSDGTYFPSISYNLNARRLDWVNPTKNNDVLKTTGDNGIQLVRTWISQWSIFGSSWNMWSSLNSAHKAQEPDVRLRHDTVSPFDTLSQPVSYPGSDTFLWLSMDKSGTPGQLWDFTPCVVAGWETPKIPLKTSTNYRIKIRFKPLDVSGPTILNKPFGLVAKYGSFFSWNEDSDSTNDCYSSGKGTPIAATFSNLGTITPDPQHPDSGWQILENNWSNSTLNFFDKFYLAIENANSGSVLIDQIWIQEILPNNQFGANIISKPRMAHHQYIDQRASLALDKTLEYADLHDVYLKLVVLEKKDYVLNIFNHDGTTSTQLPKDINHSLFYGNGRESTGQTKTRYLQQAWWRYLQARWGYSPHIHSWELLNEGDPGLGLHHVLADELGKYMHQFEANKHLVTTSFWSGVNESGWNFFKNSTSYPHVDYADTHIYAEENLQIPNVYTGNEFDDSSLFSQKLSLYRGAKQTGGPNKPVIRGETGWDFANTDLFASNSGNGLWLHNFIWAGLNPGGIIESYWVGAPTQDHIYKSGSHDHRHMFKSYYNFVSKIPLSNGLYQDATATSTNPQIRVWGQKDLVHQSAHLWIANSTNTWQNSLNNQVSPQAGSISISGFAPNSTYSISWFDTYSGSFTNTSTATSNSQGHITFPVDLGIAMVSMPRPDIALVINANASLTPSPTPIQPTDINADGKVDIFDYSLLLQYFGTTNDCNNPATIDADCDVDIFDYNLFVAAF